MIGKYRFSAGRRQEDRLHFRGDQRMLRWRSRFGKRFSPVGLDLGTVQIKLIQFRLERGRIAVHRRGVFPLEKGIIVHGRVADGDALRQQLRQIFAEMKLKRRDSFLCVGNDTVIVRSFTLPAMSPAEISAAVRWEALKYHPNPAAMTTDYIVTGEKGLDGKRITETRIISVPREVIDGYVGAVGDAGFNPVGVEIEPLALCRAVRFFNANGKGRKLLLDIGGENSMLVIMENGCYLYSRILKLGVQDLDGPGSVYRGAMVEKVAEEGAPYGVGEETPGGLAARIHHALEYYYYRAPERDDRIEELLLFGGGAVKASASLVGDERIPSPAVFTFRKDGGPLHEPGFSGGDDNLFGVAGGLALRGWMDEKGH